LQKKYEQKVDAYVESVIQGLEEQYSSIDASLITVNNKMQELQMMAQQEPQNQEHAMQIEQIKQQLPFIMLKMDQVKNALNRRQQKLSKQLSSADLLS